MNTFVRFFLFALPVLTPSALIASEDTTPIPPSKPGLAARVGQDAGMAALWTATTTISTVGGVMETSFATLENLSKPFWNYAAEWTHKLPTWEKSPAQAAKKKIAWQAMPGYTPKERLLICGNCGMKTEVKGDFPGLRLSCPSCGNTLS